MAALRDALAEFVTDVFSSTLYERPILLRGVYFTSGTQEGNPIDRLLIAGLRDLGLHAQAAAMPASVGRAYFIERLMKDVILGESGLAGMNRRAELQKAAVQFGAYAAIAAAGALAVAVLFWSFNRNRSYVADVDGAVARAQRIPPSAAGAPPDAFLPRLTAVRAVVQTANRFGDDGPLGMRWGLYQGAALGKAARDSYSRELTGTLLADVADRFERRLGYAGTPPEQLYEYLKAYLMLAEPARLLPVQVTVLADAEWRLAYERQPEIVDALNQHLKVLIDEPQMMPPITRDQRLVAAARRSVRRVSIEQLVYSRLKLKYGDDQRVLRLDTEIGAGAEQALRRKSGTSLATPVPAIYTAPVFREIASSRIGEVAEQFAQEQWVWEEAGQPPVATATLTRDVIALYENDYIAFWDSVLDDVELIPVTESAAVAELLTRIGGPNSPLRGFFETVDAHTYFARPPDPPTDGGRAGESEKAEVLNKVLGRGGQPGATAEQPGAAITKHFAKIHDAVAGPPGNAPVDRALTLMGRLGKEVASSDTDVVGGALTPGSANEVLRDLKTEVAALPSELARILADAYDRSTTTVRREIQEDLSSRYQQQVVSACREVVSGNYPFVRDSRTEAPIADVARLFGPQGEFDRFFKAHLEPLVDVSVSPWRWKADVTGAEIGGSRAMLRSFEEARRIQEVLFPTNAPAPAVRFNVTPRYLDEKVLRYVLDIDGQRMEYSHGRPESKQMSWPGQGTGAVSMVFDLGTAVPPIREFKGEWALFRLLDSAQVSPESTTRYDVRLRLGDYQARLGLDALSVRNPFGMRELQQFRCEA
jgi:type VI secretion system protein ImpL